MQEKYLKQIPLKKTNTLSRTMKVSILMTFLCILSAMAENSFSQSESLTLKLTNVTIKQSIKEIEQSSDYFFLIMDDAEKELMKIVSINMDNKSINEILSLLLKNTQLSYSIVKRQVTIRKKVSPADSRQPAETVQQTKKIIRGKITDTRGEAIIGANIIEKGTSSGTVTDIDGNFSLSVDNNATLVVSYIGYATQEINITTQNTLNIILSEDTGMLEELVVVGYGTRKKGALTGAVSAISGDDMQLTKNENAQNMLTGKLPGVRVSQRSSEPGAFDSNFDIRAMGSPLIVIDGIPRGNEDFQRLDPNDIENISILKDATAAVYGVRAANGVILVTTKKGKIGKNELTYTGSYSWQIPSGMPKTVDAIGYMTLRNELSMHRREGANLVFSDEAINEYLTGKKVSTDWWSLVFKDFAPQTMHNLSATGGNEKIHYYLGLGYQNQESFFKTDDLNYNKYNIRSNITAKIIDNLTVDLNMNFIMDTQNRPNVDSWWIIRGYWKQGPHIQAYANNNPSKLYHNISDGDNPLAFINADIVGNKKYSRKWVQPAGSIQYDFPFLPGMFAKALISYDWHMWEANEFRKEYNQYRYDETTDTYQTFTLNSPNRVNRGMITRNQLLTQTSLGYTKRFNDVHNFNGLFVWETQKRSADNFSAQRDLIIPLPYLFAGITEGQIGTMNQDDIYEFTNLGLVGTLHYDYADKYLLDYSFRYDGSSKFAPGSQWGFFPSVALAWRISEEGFFKNRFGNINQLKLRTSYGKVGDDSAAAYQFISGYNYPTGGSDRRWFTAGYVFNDNYLASADNKGIPNVAITWFTANTLNVGFDFTAWNGLFSLTADYFARKRKGLLAERYGGIPTVVGANLPQENINSDLTYGVDLEIGHRNRINDFSYGVKGIFSLARVKRLYVERGPIGSSWANWKNNQNNRLQGVSVLLPGNGQYQNWEEIWNSPVFVDPWVLPGDYRYEDWNGDGEINDNDRHPIRFNQNPWMNFSIMGDARYKGFDLAFLFQGAAMASVPYGEKLREPLWGGGDAGALQQFMDRWHPADPKADPYNRNTQWIPGYYAYTGTLPDYWSTFNVENAAYLRLKSVELGYTLPKNLLNDAKISNLRIFTNAYNLLTFTKVRNIDPEHTNDLYGYIYPLNKTVSVGLSVTF